MYAWIQIDSEKDYEKLKTVLDPDFGPQRLVPTLQNGISGAVRGVLIEGGYVDKDYRSTFYNFYSKKGRKYREDCVRLHFFDSSVSFDEPTLDLRCTDNRLEDHYFGYIVLRPTLVATIGRSLLSPDIRTGAAGFVIVSKHRVHLLGYRLRLWGFPSMDQHADISVCAHAACWSILRHYSERYPQHRELLVHDITLMAHQFDPGGLVPANGLDVNEAERVFHEAGTFPLIVTKTSSQPEAFFRQFLAYLESGFPLFVAMDNHLHAVAAIGHSWASSAPLPADTKHAWDLVESVIVVDDNALPYRCIPKNAITAAQYTPSDFSRFIVPLPEKVFYPADAVDQQAIALRNMLSKYMALPPADSTILRYFIATLAGLRTYARRNQSQLGTVLVNSIMQLETAQFLWVLEYASLAQWQKGEVAARAIIDATASPHDPFPVWLAHDGITGIFFNRTSASPRATAVDLRRPSGLPLNRMEQNLRPISTKP